MKLINYMRDRSLFDIFDGIDQSIDLYYQNNHRKPKVSINNLDNSYCLSLEMPGINKKDINITINKGIINIESQRKKLNEQLFYSELDNCDYSRSFYIPEDANINKIKAKSSNGILNIEIPKLKDLNKDVKKIAIS